MEFDFLTRFGAIPGRDQTSVDTLPPPANGTSDYLLRAVTSVTLECDVTTFSRISQNGLCLVVGFL